MHNWEIYNRLSQVIQFECGLFFRAMEIRTLKSASFENGELYARRTFASIVLYCKSFWLHTKCVQEMKKWNSRMKTKVWSVNVQSDFMRIKLDRQQMWYAFFFSMMSRSTLKNEQLHSELLKTKTRKLRGQEKW